MIDFTPAPGHANLTQLRTQILLPASQRNVFDFFADAGNLELLTPPWLRFRIETALPLEMEEGVTIDYRLRLRWVSIRWRTEISLWEPPVRFVDRQVRGPYQVWEHTHTFEEQSNGTLVCDTVHFRSRGGRLVEGFFVIPDLRRIFAFRHAQLSRIFGANETLSTANECRSQEGSLS